MNKISIIELGLENGSTVFIEADSSSVHASRRTAQVGRVASIIDDARKSFEQTIEVLKPISNSIAEKLKDMVVKPEETTIEFGVKINLEGHLIIASASSEANFKISMTWKNQKDK